MEHVAEQHGQGIAERVKVQCQTDILEKRLKPPSDFEAFWSFPKRCGWKIGEDFKIQPLGEEQPITNLAVFLQSWLFFGLAFTVVQHGGGPSLSLEDLIAETYLSTSCLNRKLDEWANWEKAHFDGLRFRMIQVGWVLDHARQVIRTNCAYIGNSVGYAHDMDDALYMDDKHELVLMCLGETLSEAKASIMASKDLKLKVKLDGWHADDHAGWGPPRYVFEGMKKKGWCKRAMQLLRGQLRSNATMLMSAYEAYFTSARMEEDHRDCTAEKCKFNPKDDKNGSYSGHIGSCQGCESLGPAQETIMEILRQDGDIIPLIRFRTTHDRPDRPSLEVEPFDLNSTKKLEFVTMSHVWSDGWGNEDKNELSTCRLKFIRRQIERATKTEEALFWMDTLVVPVGPSVEQRLKTKAIRQIFQVFDKSKYTIVLDNGLKAMNRGNPNNPAEAAMRILSSVWMRRLWTLQEAYLSRQIIIPFEEAERGTMNLLKLDALEEQLSKAIQSPTSGIIRLVKDQLSHIMMGEERRDRRITPVVNHRENDPAITAKLVSNTWRATRWRSTGKPEHEVLALATLLNLKYEDTEIEKAGLDDPGRENSRQDANTLESLAVEFWTLLEQQYRGSIPSGMIFLPGERLNRRGFGWALNTWLSTHEIDYPDPLRVWKQATVLDQNLGLQVQYPGFLLYPDSPKTRGKILGTTAGTDTDGHEVKFSFPVDRSLSEWYSFNPADENTSDQLNRLQTAESTLAIILSGPQPREWPREIALLVEVEKSGNPDTIQQPVYHTRIIHRIMIWREPNHLHTQENKLHYRKGFFRGPDEPSVCLGEVLGPSQSWWVDGYVTQEDVPIEEDFTDSDDQEEQNEMSDADPVADNQKSSILERFLGIWGTPRQDTTPQTTENSDTGEGHGERSSLEELTGGGWPFLRRFTHPPTK
ncbi:hypothetical protein SCUP515_08112 [Seiridium cupressi]